MLILSDSYADLKALALWVKFCFLNDGEVWPLWHYSFPTAHWNSLCGSFQVPKNTQLSVTSLLNTVDHFYLTQKVANAVIYMQGTAKPLRQTALCQAFTKRIPTSEFWWEPDLGSQITLPIVILKNVFYNFFMFKIYKFWGIKGLQIGKLF